MTLTLSAPVDTSVAARCDHPVCKLRSHDGDVHVLTASAGNGWAVTTILTAGHPPQIEVQGAPPTANDARGFAAALLIAADATDRSNAVRPKASLTEH